MLIVVANTTAFAEETTSAANDRQLRFFESRIRPLLIDRCYDCHAGAKQEGGLRLDVADAIEVGGNRGSVVIPGDPSASLLVSAIGYRELEMPPDQPLSERERLDIEKWIADGAIWPVTDPIEITEIDRSWWAADRIDPGPSPDPVAGIDSPTVIDRYIDQQLHPIGLQRAPNAPKEKLIRRLSYDLLGLPPSLKAIEVFVDDQAPDALSRLLDRMFADPAYGERMARLWLDLVRYAESDGWRADAYRQQAWRYRQFVTDAFNAKMAYDQFVALQLAGDEIAPTDDQAAAAVGFLRLGIYEYNQRDAEGQWRNIVDEMTDVTADVFLATGLACAKCHDHKFDPISRADYFHLRSVFEPVLFVDRKLEVERDSAVQAQIASLLDQLREVEGDGIEQIRDFTIDRFPLVAQAMYFKPLKERNSYEHQIAYMMERQVFDEGLKANALQQKIGKERMEKRAEILKQLQELQADPYDPAELATVVDAPGPIRPTTIPGRSAELTFQPAIPRIFGGQDLEGLSAGDAVASSGRRSALAQWITSADNPIAARVMVNRLWQYHFGTGLVSTPNDFGRLGAAPSHPRLLDYLAKRFIDSGWDIQAIQREMLMSAAYQQSSVHPQAELALRLDSSNRLCWHKSVRRLDAEQFRDTLLVVTDGLIDQVGGPSIEGTGGRRSLYLRRYRNKGDEMLAALDAPPGVVGTAKRDQTTTAPQSLMMINSPRMIGVAKGFAARVARDLEPESTVKRRSSGDPEGAAIPTEDRQFGQAERFVGHAYRLLTGQPPDAATVQLLAPLVAEGEAGKVDACHVLLNGNAFLYLD